VIENLNQYASVDELDDALRLTVSHYGLIGNGTVLEVGLWQQKRSPQAGELEHDNGRPRLTDLLDVVDVLAATGSRIGEELALRRCDIDLDTKPPTATPEFSRPSRRGPRLLARRRWTCKSLRITGSYFPNMGNIR